MTLTLDLPPDIERDLLAKAQAKGISPAGFIEEIVVRAVKAEEPSSSTEAQNLVELFENSPFKGLGMKFERDKDYGREIEL